MVSVVVFDEFVSRGFLCLHSAMRFSGGVVQKAIHEVDMWIRSVSFVLDSV